MGSMEEVVGSRTTSIYHTFSCRWVGRIAVENRLLLASEAAAAAAGYRPCRVCCSMDPLPQALKRSPEAHQWDEWRDLLPEFRSVGKYKDEIAAYLEIDSDLEERELIRLAQRGWRYAAAAVIRANLREVFAMAERREPREKLPLAELVAAGNVGLLEALWRFDPDGSKPFGSFAERFVRQSVEKAIARGPMSMRGPVPLSAIPTATRMSAPSRVVPWDELIGDTETASRQAFMTDRFRRLMQKVLTEREREVLTRCYGLGYSDRETLQEIGDSFGLTRERIRQIRDEGVRKLKQAGEAWGF